MQYILFSYLVGHDYWSSKNISSNLTAWEKCSI